MDVLFGSIDVRELLSTQDFEESSPLSAPDLRLLIDRLQVRSVHIKEKVRDYIHSHHNDFAEIFSRCSDAILKTEDISSDVNNILSLISDHPIDIEIHDAASEISSKRRELKEKKELLSLVQTIVNLMGRLKLVRENLKTGRLIDAAESVRDLKKALLIREDQGVDEREPAVFGLLRKEWMECFDELQEVLVTIMGNAVHFEPENGRVRVKSRLSSGAVEEVELRTVLKAMDVAGTLDYGLAKVADLIVKQVVIPAVRDGRNFNFEEGFNQDSTQMAEAILSLVPSSDSKVDSAAIYSGLVQVIKFIHKSICFQNGRWMKCFGRLTWPRISELVISNILSKTAPDDATKVAEFQKIIKLTTEFEAVLKELMFISSTDSEDEKLTNFALNIEVHFASRKKKEILAKARNLVLLYDTASPSDAVDLLFLPEKCVVSKAASQLMELVHQTLQDVCLSSTRVAMEFYHAARDALLLYEAVVPVTLERQLNGINQVATLVHNDCLFLCQEILGLAFEYRPDFPSCMKEKVVFADMAPRFHQMAEQTLQKQIQLVSMSLKEAIDGADGFQNTHQKQQYDSAKFSIDQVVFILEKVHIIWEPLLQPLTYKRIMCIVLDLVFLKITQDILLLDDIAAEETLQLQRLIHMTLDSLSSLVGSIVAIEEKDELQEDVTPNQLDVLLPSLRKLRILADLLDMSLKSITTTWESGELANCGFTSSEVKDVIKAIFTDSPLRRECLWRIEVSTSSEPKVTFQSSQTPFYGVL